MRSSARHEPHIITRHATFEMSYHYRKKRSYRGEVRLLSEQLPKKTIGMPRDRLIPVPKHISDALRDQTSALVMPRQMA